MLRASGCECCFVPNRGRFTSLLAESDTLSWPSETQVAKDSLPSGHPGHVTSRNGGRRQEQLRLEIIGITGARWYERRYRSASARRPARCWRPARRDDAMAERARTRQGRGQRRPRGASIVQERLPRRCPAGFAQILTGHKLRHGQDQAACGQGRGFQARALHRYRLLSDRLRSASGPTPFPWANGNR